MNDDLISRQAAIDALEKEKPTPFVNEDGSIDPFGAGQQNQWYRDGIAIMNMPSAQPEQKKGKWIPHREISREYIGTILVNVSYDYWFCETCGYRMENGQPMYNFCPNCGAEMEDDDD